MASTHKRLIIILITIKVVSSKLTIEPQESEVIVTSGAKFELTCKGWDTNITFRYQNSPNKFTEFSIKDGVYVAYLRFNKADYRDTGFYYCASVQNKSEEKSVYVYVRDVLHLLTAGYDIADILSVEQYQDLILPCKPTSPDVVVKLYKDSELVETIQHDPQKGFIIKNVMLFDSGYYTCAATRADLRNHKPYQLSFTVHVLPPSESVPKPEIKVEGYEGPYILEGQDITIGCHVIIDVGVQVTLDWQIPNHVSRENFVFPHTHMEKMLIYGKEKKRAYRNLEIKQVVTAFSGKYTCHVKDHSGNENEENYHLEIFSVDRKFLNLTMEGKSEIQVRASENEAQWLVHIDGYPAPICKWFGPDMQLLSDSSKYSITAPKFKKPTKVTVHNLTIEDSGVYTLHASNSEKNDSLKVTLLVEDKPKVTFGVSSSYHYINKNETLTCSVTAYPVPRVSWNFVECTDYEPFCDKGNTMAPVELEPQPLENVKLVKWISVAHLYTHNSGIVTCRAENHLGVTEDHMNFKVTDVRNGFEIWGPNYRVLSSDNIIISCGASRYEYNSEFIWIYKNAAANGEYRKITNSSRNDIFISTNKTSFSHQTSLYINNVSSKSSGSYKCLVKSFLQQEYQEKEFILKVQERKAPIFTNFTTMNGSTLYLKVGRPVSWNCSVTGIPEPKIVWLKDDEPVDTKNGRIQFENRNHTLHITYTEFDDAGVYKCQATNTDGSISVQTTLKLKGPPTPSKAVWWVFLILVGCLFILIIVLLAFFRKLKREKQKRKDLISVGLYNFAEGHAESINPNIDIGEQADLLPYDKKWEFPRAKLKLGKQIGAGAFGVVMKGEIEKDGALVTVAVKMVKRSSDSSHIKSLAAELKIMAHLGQHLNVVNLLGACTSNLHNRELMVIVEYCRYGNLHNFLRNHRNNFINQLNAETGTLNISEHDLSDLTYIKPASNQSESAVASDYINGQSVQTEVTSVSTPVGEDGYLLNRDAEMSGAYQSDYKINLIRPIKTIDLFCWCYQVAKGMEYLAYRKVLHGDLAARNILLAEGNIVKICDFGLAKSMYSRENYKNKKRDIPLPIKWMSIEAIRDGIFSTQSDIWSFGVLMWEVFSMATAPFPGMLGEEFFNKLCQGSRMPKPAYATEDVYNLMLECWKDQPMLRPSFTECAERLGNMLGDPVKQYYMELNSTYLDTQAAVEHDYFSQLIEPTYENCKQAGMGDYVPEGYLCMKPKNKTDAMNEMELKPMITPGSNSFLNPGYEDMKSFMDHKYYNISRDVGNTSSHP